MYPKVKCEQLERVVRQFKGRAQREKEAREIIEIIFLLAEKVD